MKKLLLTALLILGCSVVVNADLTGQLSGPGVLPPTPSPNVLPSGFYGQSLFYHSGGPSSDTTSVQGYPYATHVSVYDTNGSLVKRVTSNRVGQFHSFVMPGDYVLIATPLRRPLPPKNINDPANYYSGYPSAPVSITVNTNQLTSVAIVYSVVE